MLELGAPAVPGSGWGTHSCHQEGPPGPTLPLDSAGVGVMDFKLLFSGIKEIGV